MDGENQEVNNESLEVDIDSDLPESLEVEVVDDTPPKDRGRKPVDTVEEDVVGDEVEAYSKKVRSRIDRLRHQAHDERREKERFQRELSEMEKFARQSHQRYQELERRYVLGEASYADQVSAKNKAQLENAQEKYRKAFEMNDADAIAKATAEIAAAATEEVSARSWAENAKQKANSSLQQEKEDVDLPVSRTDAPVDKRAQGWADKNSEWFGKDSEMTATAYGVHEKLIKQGVHPVNDAETYYAEIDKTLRKRYPEYEWDEIDDTDLTDEDDESPAPKTASKPPAPKKSAPKPAVAPVTRTPTGNGKKVTLTQSQLRVADRLGLTAEQYARELLKLEGV